jgi:hypothetical protein
MHYLAFSICVSSFDIIGYSVKCLEWQIREYSKRISKISNTKKIKNREIIPACMSKEKLMFDSLRYISNF